MHFRPRRDRGFLLVISVVIGILFIACIGPLFLEEARYLPVILIMIGTFILSGGLILWTVLDIQYIFRKDHLYVKGGPFRSRIPYNDINNVKSTRHVLVGYRIISSTDGLQIYYRTGLWGSVIISPLDKEGFMEELQKRCAGVQKSWPHSRL